MTMRLPESQGDSGEPLQGPESVQRRAFPAHDKYKCTFAPPRKHVAQRGRKCSIATEMICRARAREGKPP